MECTRFIIERNPPRLLKNGPFCQMSRLHLIPTDSLNQRIAWIAANINWFYLQHTARVRSNAN